MRLILLFIILAHIFYILNAIGRINDIADSLDGIHTELVNVHWELKEGQLVIPTK
tara:strand:- start:84 stop:248 length:165 start_codon:yes stop_codon:yes gene_type:complete